MIIPETFAEGERRVTAIGEGRPGVIHLGSNTTGNPAAGLEAAEFDARVEANQRRLAAEIRPSYDFIVCESGSSGSVVAGRLAESGHASVLLLEAGGTDDVPTVREAQQSLANLRSERDWAFQAVPNPLLNVRNVTRCVVEEVESGDWGIGGNALTTADVQALARGKAA
jgi:GMC oxidoreductase